MKNELDYKDNFRILKRGKVSLVVSAMLLGSIVSDLQAADYTVAGGATQTTRQVLAAGDTFTINGTFDYNASANNSGVLMTADMNASSYVTINNGATFKTTTTTGTAWGIDFNSFNNALGTVTNSGTMNILATGAGAYAVRIQNSDYNQGSIENTTTGHIEVNSTNSEAIGFGFAMNGGPLNTTASSKATISNSGVIDVTGDDADGFRGTHNGISGAYAKIINSGTINVTGTSSARGIYSQRNYVNAEIINEGTITVKSSGSATGLHSGSKNYGRAINKWSD